MALQPRYPTPRAGSWEYKSGKPQVVKPPAVVVGGPQPLDGTTAGTSTTTGNVAVAISLGGTTAGTAVTTGSVAVSHPLAGTSTGTSTTTATLFVAISLSATTAGTSTTAGDLTTVLGARIPDLNMAPSLAV